MSGSGLVATWDVVMEAGCVKGNNKIKENEKNKINFTFNIQENFIITLKFKQSRRLCDVWKKKHKHKYAIIYVS